MADLYAVGAVLGRKSAISHLATQPLHNFVA